MGSEPQLRQMVLENTERINKNEMAINRMHIAQAEQSRKMSERDEWLENSRREFDRQIRISNERMDRLERFSEAAKAENEKGFQELREMVEKTNASISRISTEFIGATGHIIEGLASSSVDKVFKDAGFDLLHYGKNIKPKSPEANQQMEIDVLLGNDQFIVPVEVKADFTKKKVKRFIHSMGRFRKFFPEFADKEVIAAVAAINYGNGADTFAHEEGLLVIRVSSDNIFSLDPVDPEKLRRF